MKSELTPRTDGMWLIDYTGPDANGVERRQRISTGTRDQADARRQLSDFQALKHPKHPLVQRIAVLEAQANWATGAALIPATTSAAAAAKSNDYTLSDAFDDGLAAPRVWKGYASTKNLDSDLRQIRAMVVPPEATRLGDQALSAFSTDRLEAIYQFMITAPRKSNGGKPLDFMTARKHMGRITQVCEAAHRWWKDGRGKPLLANMPLRPIMERGDGGRKRVVQPHEEKMIFDAIAYHRENGLPGGNWWVFERQVAFCMIHGPRLDESLFVGPECLVQDSDPVTGETHLSVRLDPRMTKGGTGGRTFRIHPSFLPVIDDLNARAEVTFKKKIVEKVWFHSAAPRWFPMPEGKTWSMWAIIRKHILKTQGHDLGTGKGGLALHSLRHTAGTRLVEDGVGIYDLSKRLGHTDIKITQQYIHADRTSERRIAETISRKKAAPLPFVSDQVAAE